ncbi:MAG: TonB-dependent receptor [Alphaproteobacteria bacterium]|nr:TonB-dependent receptor [Alphaproteobacteria bacterium]MDE2630318.1 TonB-dependent receptor [Alphaproteobacteria bacterium]
MRNGFFLVFAFGFLGTVEASAQTGAGLERVVVTATRVPQSVDQVPADISVVSGAEMSDRDAWTLSASLNLVPGVEAPSGGDAGPSSAVPSFWGLHEFDAFLLVVDDVPWGGAFNPAITTLDLTDVERIEVLKGAAPVMYGATSFVGVVHVLHYPAGEAANEADVAYGSFGSARGSASFVLPPWGGARQSLAIDGRSLGFADKREAVADGKFLYRGALDIGRGTLRLDADATLVRDVPPSPVIRVGTALTKLTPLDANFNPADARIDENKYHVALGYSRPTDWGSWDTLLSYAHSDIVDVRAFLHPDLSGAADTQNQHRLINDAYGDTHLTNPLSGDTTLIVGADLLYGLDRQTTRNGNSAYTVPLDGSALPPPAAKLPVDEIGTVDDRRIFAGQYAQLDWKPGERWNVIGGIRLNETAEHKRSSDSTFLPPQLSAESASRTVVRLSETAGASYRAWAQDGDEVVFYGDYRNAFKPAAVDFGPDYTPQVLLPETAQSYEAGIKGAAAGGLLTYQAELFLQNFQNLAVATNSGELANAGKEQLKGIDLETRYQVTPDLALAGNFAYHDARFTRYLFFDGVSNVDVAGKQLTLAPKVLASAGILYVPQQGLRATLVANYVGRRYLDEKNTAPAGAYATLDMTLGYRIGRYAISLEENNLTNERPPVTASEFGSESFYLLPARAFWLRLSSSL